MKHLLFLTCLFIASCGTAPQQAPTVAFASPIANSVVAGEVTLNAIGQAFAAEGATNRVEKVLMLVNNQTIEATRQSSGIKPRFSYQWNTATLADGMYELQASVTDTQMNTGRAEPILVRVENGAQNGPLTQIQTPVSGETLNGQVAVVVQTIAGQAAVAQVEILIDGISVQTLSAEPYVYRWETAKSFNGAHRLQVKAKGTDGKFRITAPLLVTTNGGL